MTLREILRLFLARNLRIDSDKTKKLYRYAVEALERMLEREPTTSDFSDDLVAEYIQHRREGRSIHTVHREAERLITLWKFAAKLNHCPWPTIQLRRKKPPIPEAWLESEVRALFKAAAAYPTLIKGCDGATFVLAALGLFWDTGERFTPVTELLRADVNVQEFYVRFRGRKGGAQDKIRQISRRTSFDLQRLLAQHDHSKVFRDAHKGTHYYHLEKVLIAAGLPTDRRSKFHRLRKSHASHLHAAGGDASKSLDHSSPDITRESYLDPRIVKGENVVPLLFDPRGGILRRLLWRWRAW